MKIGIFGGTFDPIHLGHLSPVEAALEALGLERVSYIPTASPPHKTDREMAPALARYCMVELALLDRPRLVVDPLELTPGRRAYTVETLETYRTRRPDDELFLLLGTDSLFELHRWHRWRELSTLATIVLLARPGWAVPSDRSQAESEIPAFAGIDAERLVTVHHQLVDVSSTEVRRRLAGGDPASEELLPPRVVDFIRKYGLYA